MMWKRLFFFKLKTIYCSKRSNSIQLCALYQYLRLTGVCLRVTIHFCAGLYQVYLFKTLFFLDFDITGHWLHTVMNCILAWICFASTILFTDSLAGARLLRGNDNNRVSVHYVYNIMAAVILKEMFLVIISVVIKYNFPMFVGDT